MKKSKISIEDFRNEKDPLFEIEKQIATARIIIFKKMLRSLIDEFKAVVKH